MRLSHYRRSALWASALAWLCALAIDSASATITPTGQVTPTYDGSDPWNAGGELLVGNTLAGSLEISGGSRVNSASGNLGIGEDVVGTMTVTGTGSTWHADGFLMVGRYGSGRLDILDGGIVDIESTTWIGWAKVGLGEINFDNGTLTTDELFATGSDLRGTGTINTRGLVSDVALAFNSTTGLHQQIVLDSLPNQSITINLDVSAFSSGRYLGAGYRGVGTLSISDGLFVTSQNGYLGYHDGSTGTATVSGSRSTWSITGGGIIGGLYVGRFGDGTLMIENGGRVNAGQSFVGAFEEATGTVTVSDRGSIWSISGGMAIGLGQSYFGPSGDGVVNISNGGLVTAVNGIYIDPGSSINIKSGGMLARRSPPGRDGSLADFLDLINGEDAINYWDGTGWSNITNAVFGVDYTLDYVGIDGRGYTVLTVGKYVEGDFDGDEDVDGSDFLAWQRGESPSPLSQSDLAAWESRFGTLPQVNGDFDGDSDVDGRDFLIWQRGGSPDPLSRSELAAWEFMYGATPTLAATTLIPEPTSGWLIVVGLLSQVGRRHGRHGSPGLN